MIKPVMLQKVFQNAARVANKGCSKLGGKIANGGVKVDKFFKNIDPTGGNNSFIGLVGLMVGMVIVPRVITAAKRNPENKEATKDEIVEILFRDIQTVGIILFALKMINTLVGRGASKITGLPMTNKPFKPVFESTTKGMQGIKEKASEFMHHPLEKLKIVGKNILDTIHPTGGVTLNTTEQFIDRYSGYGSIAQINKMYDDIALNKGNVDKIHNIVMDNIIGKQEAIIKQQEAISHAGFGGNANKAEEVLEALKKVKENGVSSLQDENLDENVKTLLIDFFKNPDNKLVNKGKKLGAILRWLALGIESGYLGFGLPALNQARLEKKYLSKNGGKNKNKIDYKEERVPVKNSALEKRMLNPNEAQIFQKFLGQ